MVKFMSSAPSIETVLVPSIVIAPEELTSSVDDSSTTATSESPPMVIADPSRVSAPSASISKVLDEANATVVIPLVVTAPVPPNAIVPVSSPNVETPPPCIVKTPEGLTTIDAIPVSVTAPEPSNSHVPVSSPNEAPVAPFADKVDAAKISTAAAASISIPPAEALISRASAAVPAELMVRFWSPPPASNTDKCLPAPVTVRLESSVPSIDIVVASIVRPVVAFISTAAAEVTTTSPEVAVDTVKAPLVAVTFEAPVPSIEKVLEASMSTVPVMFTSRLAPAVRSSSPPDAIVKFVPSPSIFSLAPPMTKPILEPRERSSPSQARLSL